MRLFPVVPVLPRAAVKETKINGYTIPVGTIFMIGAYRLHRDKEYWGEDAEFFIPDRWKTAGEIHPFAFLPFSGERKISRVKN